MKYLTLLTTTCLFLISTVPVFAQSPASLYYKVSVPEPARQFVHVELNLIISNQDSVVLKMPNWTPGYYQLMNYAEKVSNFTIKNKTGALKWQQPTSNSWKIHLTKNKWQVLSISYDVKATHNFVAGNFVNEERAYLSPAGIFLYPNGISDAKITVEVQPYTAWTKVATGLPKIKGSVNSFHTSNFDVLFDSPILMGNLDSLPSFKVDNKPHYFFAYKPGEFDRVAFMNDLKKIISTASGIIGDVPYTDYSFLAIGPGGGGIEHLNSTSVAFNGTGLDTNRKAKLKLYSFLSHEYFHHYNVKRIRPIELGPFDYDNGSRTKMLWLSEGVTVYYEPIILSRAGLLSEDELLKYFGNSIQAYESKPGRQFQTPADASYQTWEEGPFGRTADEVNKTISPYDKGALLGMLLDFKIRHSTSNKKSLDDLMKLLYNKYYKKEKRGFTEDEFRKEAEMMATVSLDDFFDYIYTLKAVDYTTYLGYAGLQIDLAEKTIPGAWTGLSLRDRNDSLLVADVEWQSPAWNAGLRKGHVVLTLNGQKINAAAYNDLLKNAAPGNLIKITAATQKDAINSKLVVAAKKIIPYSISKISHPSPLQTAIYKSWRKN